MEKFKKPNEIFNCKVFNREVRKRRLAPATFKKLEATILNRIPLDTGIADEVAKAMKEWALWEHGATHYTHWFQPLTGSTAEKHDSFAELDKLGNLSMEFSGTKLVKGEPDASSFPSGGLRATFEARGYTAWDPISPAFIRETKLGATLFIPSVFFSYTGEALDLKTPVLRSQEALSKSAKKLLKTLGKNIKNVTTVAGIEQEYFLVNIESYNARPDLVACGRTLIGNSPYRGQELDDHYFGAIKNKILLFMQHLENELYKLGIPVKTRHNEVAPSQFELAAIFQDANLSIDQNLIIMEMIDEVACKHKLKALLHEKPFAGINGSGKHCNWSIVADDKNLLDPGKSTLEHTQFLIMIACVVRAVDKYSIALRISVASPGNDHRLGANEAPPAIMSIFLGEALEESIKEIIDDKKSVMQVSKSIDLLVKTLPSITADDTDRNRTSPIAFTGNKFEFRALGSAQNPASPNYTLNTIMADSMDYVAEEIDKRIKKGKTLDSAIQSVIKSIFKEHSKSIFSGDNYSDKWIKIAEKRGLINLKKSVEAIENYTNKNIVSLFEKYQVLTEKEIKSRQNIRANRYSSITEIEARSMLDIINSMVLPDSYKHQEQLASSISSIKELKILCKEQETELQKITVTINELITQKRKLAKYIENAKELETELESAIFSRDKIIPVMELVRIQADLLESMVDNELWQLPKYREILFHL